LGENHSRVGQTLKHMLSLYEEQGELQKAIDAGERALRITEHEFGLDDLNVAGILLRLGHVYVLGAKYQDAIKCFNRCLEISTTKNGEQHPFTADIYYELGCFYLMKPEDVGSNLNNEEFGIEKAEKLLQKALTIKEKTQGLNHPDVSRILNRLGSLYVEYVKFDQAEKYYIRALEIRETVLGKNHSRVAQTLKHLLTLSELQEQFPKSISYGLRAIQILSATYGSESVQVAQVLVRLAQSYFLKDGATSFEGKKEMERAIQIFIKKYGKEHKRVIETQNMLSTLQQEIKQKNVVTEKVSKETKKKELEKKLQEEASSGLDKEDIREIFKQLKISIPEFTYNYNNVPSAVIPPCPPLPPKTFWDYVLNQAKMTEIKGNEGVELMKNIHAFKSKDAKTKLKKQENVKKKGKQKLVGTKLQLRRKIGS